MLPVFTDINWRNKPIVEGKGSALNQWLEKQSNAKVNKPTLCEDQNYEYTAINIVSSHFNPSRYVYTTWHGNLWHYNDSLNSRSHIELNLRQ